MHFVMAGYLTVIFAVPVVLWTRNRQIAAEYQQKNVATEKFAEEQTEM